MTQDIQKYGFIDALRGYAILMVLLVHSSQSVAPINSTLQLLMSDGARGVQLFYIASALTLCMSWEFRRPLETFPVRNFFIRRIFRIAPMFEVAIVFYVFLYGFSPRYWAPNGIEWWFVPLTALFLHGFHPETITSVVPGGWSIAVEMNFYLILPFLLRYLRTTRSLVIFLVFSLLLYAASKMVCSYLLSSHYPPEQQYLVSSFSSLNFFGQLPVFAIGILAYSAFKNPGNLKRVASFGSWIFIAIVVLASLSPFPARIIGNQIVVGFGFALFAIWLACYPTRILVNWGIMQFGKISFSMYLTHFAVLEAFSKLGISAYFAKDDASSILHYLCVVAVTAPLSYLFYRTIERQGILIGIRLIDRLEQSIPGDAPIAEYRLG
jgi:peptidoglycan/LPS O-acetylase OafA/YrhL